MMMNDIDTHDDGDYDDDDDDDAVGDSQRQAAMLTNDFIMHMGKKLNQ